MLNLQDGRKAIRFLFDNGKIAGIAFPEETVDSSPLGKRLVRGGLLTPEAWKKAFDQHREELVSLESVLSKNQAVRNEDLSAVLRLLISETVYGLFKWTGGNFRFEAREVVSDPHLLEPINAEFLLLDVLRMVDEWPLLADRIPASQMVLRKVNEMATLEMLAGSAWADKRSFQMEVIYELINGQRTISDIIDQSFVGEFETCKNLITLMDAGMIEPVGINPVSDRRNGGRSPKNPEKYRRVPASRRSFFGAGFPVVRDSGKDVSSQPAGIRGLEDPAPACGENGREKKGTRRRSILDRKKPLPRRYL